MKAVNTPITDERRQEIFRALIEAQDKGQTVKQSRLEVVKKFAITEKQLDGIEQEGLAKEWPPL